MSFLSRDVIGGHRDAGRLVAHRVPGFHRSRERALVPDRPIALDEASSHVGTALFDHFGVLPPDELLANRPLLEKRGAEAEETKAERLRRRPRGLPPGPPASKGARVGQPRIKNL